jgi:hypothetical protein
LIGIQDEDRVNKITGKNNRTGPLSEGDVVQDNKAHTYWYRHSVSISRLSKRKKGRRLNINHNLDVNNRFNDYISESDISYLYPVAYDSVYAQLRKERIPRTDASITFNYSEPIGKKFTIRLGGRYEYSKFNNGVSTFNRNGANNKLEVLNTLLSSNFRRISNRFFINPALEYKLKQDFTMTPSIRFLEQDVTNRLVTSSLLLKQKQFNILPGFSVVYKQLTLNYNKDVILPAFQYLNPVRDISNPYFITKGNSALLPLKRDNFSLNYFFNDPKRYINAGGWVNVGYTDNDIVQSIVVDDRGVQTSMPVNADNTRNYSMNWNVNKQYKNKQNIIFSWNTGNWMNVTRSQLFFNNISGWQTTFIYNHWFGAGLNLNDKFEWTINYSFGKNFTKYTSDHFKKLNVSSYDLGNEVVLRWPKHLIWETQFSYSYNGNIPAGLPKSALRWNAALNITMLKNETGVLKLAVNDILNRNQNISVNAIRNMVTSTQNNILGQYFLATFSYNVRAAGVKKRIGGRERFFLF